MQNPLRSLPSVNDLLDRPPLRRLGNTLSRNVVVSGVRSFLERMRGEVQFAAGEMHVPSPGELAERIAEWILREEESSLKPVINATGILLHTGLGRAPLAPEAVRAIADVASGYATVEVDPQTGKRSSRVRAVERLLKQITGAEAAAVVNNNAAATLLALAALAHGREVIVSRGQLIEIGGSYRLPEVMTAGGVRLREVGTTNKTRAADYEAAIGDQTAALMRVHTSNYAITGFAESASLAELIALGKKHKLPVIDDIGSGALVDFAKYGLAGEPQAPESIAAGADLVLFSGDKLLGGPQCGILAGHRELIEKISRHPLMRAMRVDKITLAALAATLTLYRDPETAELSIPLLSLLATSSENLRHRAQHLAPQLAAAGFIGAADAVEGETYVGGGSVPTQRIGTWTVALTPAQGGADALAEKLRRAMPAIFGRIQDDRLLLDLRSVLPSQDVRIADAFRRLDGADSQEIAEGDAGEVRSIVVQGGGPDPLPDAE